MHYIKELKDIISYKADTLNNKNKIFNFLFIFYFISFFFFIQHNLLFDSF